MARISPAGARATVFLLRASLGLGAWLAPESTGRVFGINVADNPAAPYLARLFAAREGWMAVEVLLARDAARRRRTLRRHAVLDLLDAVAAFVAGRSGGLRLRAAVPAGASSVAAAALSVMGGSGD